MGSNDIPPPHVPSHVVPLCALLLQIGGGLWTAAYALYARESIRTQSYGMPMFALALNFGWEVVYALFVAESPLERSVFTLWLALDCVMVYGLVAYAHHEWSHAPWIARHAGLVFAVMAVASVAGHGAFAWWWIDNNIGQREGKFYRGVVGPDTSELGFWSAVVCQAYLSAASLCQVATRQHTGGVSWTIWALRALGSIVGFYVPYAWQWFFWNEAHEYFMSPFAVFLWGTSVICDIVYPFAHWRASQAEQVLHDGRKVNRHTHSMMHDRVHKMQ